MDQHDADAAWEKALAEHPELKPDDVASELLTFAREMFGGMPGRSMHLDDFGNVVVEFKVTYPFPLDGGVHTIGCSFVLSPKVLRGGEGAAMRVEQDVQRQILTHLLPALDQKALDLGGNTASRKVATIKNLVESFPPNLPIAPLVREIMRVVDL